MAHFKFIFYFKLQITYLTFILKLDLIKFAY